MGGRHTTIRDGKRLIWHAETLWRHAASLPQFDLPLERVAELDMNCWFEAREPTLREVARHAGAHRGGRLALLQAERKIGLVLQRDPAEDAPGQDELYPIGTIASVVRYLTAPNGTRHLIVQGERRFRVHELIDDQPYVLAMLVGKPDVLGASPRSGARPGLPVGEFEHAEPAGTERADNGAVASLQEDCRRSGSAGSIAGRRVRLNRIRSRRARSGWTWMRPTIPLHGQQEGGFFHGYYKCYCYLPLYIFCGDHLLCARLRPSNIDGAAGSVDELTRIVAQIRESWPTTRIVIRGDSGFCRDAIMSWCEDNDVDYVLGLARNARLVRVLGETMQDAQRAHEHTGQAARRFLDFTCQTRKSWTRRRRVVGKAEYLSKGPNPRFVVTSLSRRRAGARRLYEKLYCTRGDMENRIKEQQLGLFADHASSATMRANQLRLYFASLAYVLMHGLRRLGLQGTSMAQAQCTTIRLKVLKIAARSLCLHAGSTTCASTTPRIARRSLTSNVVRKYVAARRRSGRLRTFLR